MEYNDLNQQKELDLKLIIFRVFYSWRKIILFGIIMSLLLGGYRYFSLNRTLNNEVNKRGQEKAYKTALDTYNINKETLETEIKNLQNSISNLIDYNDNSILMKINPFNEQLASISYYVDTDYQIMPELSYQNMDTSDSIIKAYINKTQSNDIIDYMDDKLSVTIDKKYLKELITTSFDFENNMFFILVAHIDLKICEEIASIIKEYIEQQKDSISNIIGNHSLSIIDYSVQSTVNLDLDSKQKNNQQTLAGYETNLKTKQDELNNLSAPVKAPDLSGIIMKSSIKFIIVGFIAGCFIAFLVYIFIYIMSDRLYDLKNLRTVYKLKILGKIDKRGKRRLFGFIDKVIKRLEGTSEKDMAEDEAIERIYANLKAIINSKDTNNHNIIISGAADIDKINNICTKLAKIEKDSSYRFVSSGNINYTADTINKLMECNAIVLVEEIGKSTYNEIGKQLDNINDLGKDVVGVVLI